MKGLYSTKVLWVMGAFVVCGFLAACAEKAPVKKSVVQVQRGGVSYTALGLNEVLVKQSIVDSKFTMVKRGDSFVIIMPVKTSFNAGRPDVLLPSTLAPLTNIAKLLSQDPNWVVAIVGHTDTTGKVVANNELSLQRAKSVASVFSVAGVTRSRMATLGVGSTQPLAKNTTAKGCEENRRVELIIAPKATSDISTLANLYAVTKYQRNN